MRHRATCFSQKKHCTPIINRDAFLAGGKGKVTAKFNDAKLEFDKMAD
jgi:hypothetical protein